MKRQNVMTTHLIWISAVTAGILAIPLIGMQITADVNWTASDFIIMGVVIFVTGLLISISSRKLGKYRIAAISGIILMFLWLWAELAVGIFTNWGS